MRKSGEQQGGLPPYFVRLDADKARELAQQGATILLLDVPPGTAVGIDHQIFLSGPKFQGVKMIPPGPHMLTYYSPGGFAAPIVRWMPLEGKQVVVMRWQAATEMLAEVVGEEEGQFAQGVRNFDFDSGLAPYNLAAYRVWSELAGAVTGSTLKRLLPECLDISITAEAKVNSTAAEAELDEHLMRAVGRCSFTPLPLRVHSAGLTPAEITAANLDKTAALEQILRERFEDEQAEIVAEFQVAFLNFVMGHSLEGYAHWKDSLHLMCCCGSAATGGLAQLVLRFARALRCQLQVTLDEKSSESTAMGDAAPFGVPMVEELLSTSFLKPLLGNWIEDIEDGSAGVVAPELRREVRYIKALVQKRLGFRFGMELLGDDEDDEYAPVVVET